MADRNGYIGRAPSDSSIFVARQTFSPTGITTDFTFASGYTVGYLDAYLNGARLIEGQDYTATDGSVISLISSATSGDVLELVAYKAFNAATIDTAPGNLTVNNNLTVGGNLNVTGVTTLGAGSSVSFATTSFGLSGTPDITIRNLTGVAATFTGVVTYEDVTNVDSVGIITARAGIRIGTAGAASTLSSDGSAVFSGIVTSVEGRLISGVGIQSAGTVIGTGITTLNFVGTGNTFAVSGSTVNISIAGGAGGGGGAELDITASLFL